MLIDSTTIKPYLTFLSVLSIINLLVVVAALVVQGIKKYIGFLIGNGHTYVCSSYLTAKMEYAKADVLNVAFGGGVVATVMLLCMVVQIQYVFKTNQGPQEQAEIETFNNQNQNNNADPFLSFKMFIALFVECSLGFLGLVVPFGYFMTYIVEMGFRCLGQVEREWIIFGCLYGLALFFMTGCWVILVVIRGKQPKQKEQQEVMEILQRQPIQTKENKQEKPNINTFETQQNPILISHICSSSSPKSPQMLSTVPQPAYLTYLYEELARQRQQKIAAEQQNKNMIKQPLIPKEVESDDKCSSDAERSKVLLVTFEDYKKQQERDKRKKEEEEKVIMRLMEQEDRKMKEQQQLQQKKIQARRKKLSGIPLSPDDPDFDRIFKDQESQPSQELHLNKQKSQGRQVYFPANFAPSNEAQRKAFERYKRKLLRMSKGTFSPRHNAFKHPQNITGGRSKRAVRKFLDQSRRPQRNGFEENMSPRSRFEPDLSYCENHESKVTSPKKSVSFKNMQPQSSSQQSSEQYSAHFGGTEDPNSSFRPLEITPPPRPFQVEHQIEREQPEILYYRKQLATERKRKKLFNQPQKPISIKQVVSTLVKGVEQMQLKNRLYNIRKRRNSNISAFRGQKGEKLIEAIRGTYY